MVTHPFYETLLAEVTENAFGLSQADYAVLGRYYRGLAANERLRPFYQYNWRRRIEPMVQLLRNLPRRDAPWRILDAGCGVGTESIYWAGLRDDVVVVGVDVSPERLQTAVSRLPCHEKQIGRALPVQFRDQDVFQLLQAQTFDIIWTMEAISHISPAEKFLADAYASLSQSGHIVISDSHLANPAMLWRIARLRQKGIRQTTKTISSGATIPYAEERLFTAPRLSRLLRQSGFINVALQLSVFFPPGTAVNPTLFRWAIALDKVLNAAPLIRQLGGIYTATGAK